MRAGDVLNTLDRVALFRAQAADSNRRVENIGGELDSAISLLDLGQQQQQSRDALRTQGTAGVTQGVHRAVLDWSTGVIAKLASGLRRPTATASSAGCEGKSSQQQGDDTAPAAGVSSEGERHARNARRWLSDPRTWQAFVQSLEGTIAASSSSSSAGAAGSRRASEPHTHLPQSAGLGVLRAAVFSIRDAAAPATSQHTAATGAAADADGDTAAAVALAADWAALAIRVLCGGTTGRMALGDVIDGGGGAIMRSVCDQKTSKPAATGGEGEERIVITGVDDIGVVGTGGAIGGRRERRREPLFRVSLDAYVAVLEEVVREHGEVARRRRMHPGTCLASQKTEGALTELLRFQVVVQGQQTNRRKVFASCCSKLMGSLFEILPEMKSESLKAAATMVVWDALFHEENLESYREAFAAAEGALVAAEVTPPDDTAAAAAPAAPSVSSEGAGKKKRRRKDKAGVGGDGGGDDGGGGVAAAAPRRACYQQQLFEEMVKLAGAEERSRVGAMSAAPLLLEGFIVRLGQAQRDMVDIHQAGSVSTPAAVSAVGVKRSRSSGGGHASNSGGGGGSGSSSVSPASQMFKLWAVLTTTLVGSLTAAPFPALSKTTALAPTTGSSKRRTPSLLLPFLRASNSMLELLVAHDVYRINEDWGGREFRQLQMFSSTLIRLAADAKASTSDDHDRVNTMGTSQEFIKAFRSLLRLNHSILHDDLRPVLAMTFEWAAMAAAEVPSAGGAHSPVSSAIKPLDSYSVGDLTDGKRGGCAVEGWQSLWGLAVGLVVALVDTYGRLRQVDHLVQALFGAISDQPSASAPVLRGDECAAALGCAFRQLPEGQIESMWSVFAVHLREGWTRPAAAGRRGRESAGDGVSGDELLAKEAAAELFVLFLRNLHVTSSIASGVGDLCASLAEESLRSFEGPLLLAAPADPTAAASTDTPMSKKKKKHKRKKERVQEAAAASPRVPSEFGESDGAHPAEIMLAFRPALDVYGWLLDLDTRCRFWSAVLDSPAEAGALPESLPMTAPPPLEDPTEALSKSSPLSDGALPRIVAAATAALESGHARRSDDGALLSGLGSTSMSSLPATTAPAAAAVVRRLKKTLQQVAVHRVQQIYARLNGASAVEADGTPGSGVANVKDGSAVAPSAAGVGEEDARLESEARAMVAFACGACASHGSGEENAEGYSLATTWGDESCSVRDGASWSMVMPYLPVWVGFAASDQVALFLEALFSRCAADVHAGLGEEESPPLRLLTDASFYEMEAVAQSAPAVILGKVYLAVRAAVGGSGGGRGGGGDADGIDAPVVKTIAAQPFASSVDTVVAAIQSLAAADDEDNEDALDEQTDGALWDSEGDYLGAGGGMEGVAIHRRAEAQGGDRVKDGNGGRREESLAEACCLVMLTERFPPGFVDEETIAGLLLATDALDAVCVRSMLRRCMDSTATTRSVAITDGTPKRRRDVGDAAVAVVGREGLVEAVTALRSFMLRLGRELPVSSPLLERLSPGDSLLRVIRPVGASGASLSPLLRSSVALLPFLAERCVATGQTAAVLKAVARLDLMAAGGGGDGGMQQHFHHHHHQLASSKDKRFALLHGVLSGVVTGETHRLAAAAAAAATAAAAAASSPSSEDFSDDDMSDDDEDGLPTVVAPLSQLSPSAPDNPGPLFAAVAYFMGCLPVPQLPAAAGAVSISTDLTPPLSPSILPVWGEALRLSFLGPQGQQLVFARGGAGAGAGARSRSQWVEDAVIYLRDRAEEALLKTARGASSVECSRERDDCVLPAKLVVGGGGVETGSTERSGCCHLLRAVCGCSHLLDPHLPRSVVRLLVEAFLDIIVAGERVNRNENAAQWRGEANLLQTSFCLLVQHASPSQLDEIVAVLLETLETSLAVGRTVAGGSASSRCMACSAAAAVTLVRLATQASRGAAFNAVMPNRALSLAAALCGQLRGGDRQCCMRGSGGGGGYGVESRTGALAALDGLLNRQPYASVTARVVSVVLGSLEPAARAALHAAEISTYRGHRSGSLASGRGEYSSTPRARNAFAIHGSERGGGGGPHEMQRSVVEVSLRCFLACCRVLGTILHHYAPKVFSCAPPFAALCRLLLRLFFRLAAPPPPPPSTPALAGDSRGGTIDTLSLEEQVSAASVLSRVLEQFVPHKKVLKKYAAFLLLEYVSLAGSVALEPAPRAALLAGIFAVMEACTRREMRQLHGLLAALPTGQEVFRSLNEEYQRQHKYTGKM